MKKSGHAGSSVTHFAQPGPRGRRKMPEVAFTVDREYLGRDGLWNPRDHGSAFKGGFQINVFASRRGYLELAEFIRRFARRDTSDDGDHHEHFEGLMCLRKRVRFHIILRKDDVGDSIWGDCFPENKKQRTKRRRSPSRAAPKPRS
jgi:hypothetical protein